jgi:NAD dependent epimerase/dehydratase family enzyme
MDDLVRLYMHIIEKELDGAYNALAGSDTNKVFMKTIATALSKPFWFPNVPAFALRLLFGEMALMLLHGVHASNEKIRATGFEFHHADLNEALKDLLN